MAACAPFDYVISPVSPNMPAPAEAPSPTNDPLRALEHIAFTVPYNMSEQPAASINCGYSASGLPNGVSINTTPSAVASIRPFDGTAPTPASSLYVV